MNSLIACIPSGITVEEVYDQLLAEGVAVDLQGGRIAVSCDGSLAWVSPDSEGELEREYEPDELSLIAGMIGAWQGYIIDYRMLHTAEVAVAAISARWPCVVDDEGGFIGRAQDYFERRRNNG
ncbi:hypothetical protein ACIQVT_20675 [Streptomyces sp. NPDC100445]|uniref:hypothetical protein n=1 Tax=Streptomyces sp. NPDC100445 TaxID=3366102 RepID=UPI00381671CC